MTGQRITEGQITDWLAIVKRVQEEVEEGRQVFDMERERHLAGRAPILAQAVELLVAEVQRLRREQLRAAYITYTPIPLRDRQRHE